jgi:hypothetical protein
VISSTGEILVGAKALHSSSLSLASRKGKQIPLQPIETIPDVSLPSANFAYAVVTTFH